MSTTVIPVNPSCTAEQMKKIFNDVGFSEYVKNVYSGNPLVPGSSYSKNTPVKVTKKEEPLADQTGVSLKDPAILLDEIINGKTNPLFEKALDTIRKAAKVVGYKWKELYRMMMYFGAFSFFGREEFSFEFTETKYVLAFYLHYIDPSIDTPDLKAEEDNIVHNNRKFTSIIYNKKTGIVSKSEITNSHSNSTYIRDCRTGKNILTRHALLGYNTVTETWYDRIVDNVFYDNGYVTRVECISGGVCGIDEYPLPKNHQPFTGASPMYFKRLPALQKPRRNGQQDQTGQRGQHSEQGQNSGNSGHGQTSQQGQTGQTGQNSEQKPRYHSEQKPRYHGQHDQHGQSSEQTPRHHSEQKPRRRRPVAADFPPL